MKNVKKIIVLVFIMVLLGLIFINSTKATVEEIQGKINMTTNISVKIGENVTVEIIAKDDISEDNDGLLLEYDKTKLQYVEAKKGKVDDVMIVVGNRENHPAGPDGVAIAMSSELEGNAKIPAGSTIVTITFKTLEGAKGEQEVKLVHYKGNIRSEIISGVVNIVDDSEQIGDNQDYIDITPELPTEENTNKDQDYTNSTTIGPIQDKNNYSENNSQNSEKVSYKMLEGKDATWSYGKNKNLVFRSSADFADFVNVSIDREIIDKENYIVKPGSTIIELKEEYLKTIKSGIHEISINSKRGSAIATFRIIQEEDKPDVLPKTGRNIDIVMVSIRIILLINIGIGTILYYKDKQF